MSDRIDPIAGEMDVLGPGKWRCSDCQCVNAMHESFCYRCGAGQPEGSAHDAIHLSKVGSGYVTDDGEEVPAHMLHRYGCLCGWEGAAWYVSEARAHRHFERHLEVA